MMFVPMPGWASTPATWSSNASQPPQLPPPSCPKQDLIVVCAIDRGERRTGYQYDNQRKEYALLFANKANRRCVRRPEAPMPHHVHPALRKVILPACYCSPRHEIFTVLHWCAPRQAPFSHTYRWPPVTATRTCPAAPPSPTWAERVANLLRDQVDLCALPRH